MKQTKNRILIAALLLAVSLPAFTHAQNTLVKERHMNTKKILVAFFSHTGENYAVGRIEQGNTHIVAEMIASATGGTLFRIEPATPYPDDYRACTEIAQREKRSKARPALVGEIAAEEYDVIFLGYPNWWGDLPMCVYTFLEQHDWAGQGRHSLLHARGKRPLRYGEPAADDLPGRFGAERAGRAGFRGAERAGDSPEAGAGVVETIEILRI